MLRFAFVDSEPLLSNGDACVTDNIALHIIAQVAGESTSANATLIATPLLPGTPGGRRATPLSVLGEQM